MAELNVGKPVSGENFIGREKEIEYILELLKLGQNIVIIAPRRYGKTSMVLEVLSRLKNMEVYTAFIDIFSVPTIETLSSQITASVLKNQKLEEAFVKSKNSALAMLKNLKLKAAIEDFEFILGFSELKTNNWELFEKSLDFIDSFAQKHNKRMICVFDEFGDITKLDGDKIVKMLRSKLQMHKSTSYIFSGSYESVMSNLFIKKNAPFFRFARIINLTEIDTTNFLGFYKYHLKKYKIECEEDFLIRILDFTRGHPYYSQLALQELIIFHVLKKREPSFTEIISQILQTERNYLEKTWEELSSSRETTKAIISVVEENKNIYSSLKESGINISRALKKLVLNGVLFKNESGYRLTDPALHQWIKQNVLKMELPK